MITFKTHLAEAFDRPLPYRKISNKAYVFDDIIVKFDTNKIPVDNTKTIISFGSIENRGNLSLERVVYSLTKNRTSKEAMGVYATVWAIINEYIKTSNMKAGDLIEFVAADARTIKLYTKMTENLAKRYGFTWASDDNYFILLKL